MFEKMFEKKEEELCLTDGTYNFCETEVSNQFYFWRVDGKQLGHVGEIPVLMYEQYLQIKKPDSKIKISNIIFDKSSDDKCTRITFYHLELVNNMDSELSDKSFGQKVKSLFARAHR